MNLREVAEALSLLADENRLRILHLLFREQERGAEVGAIAEVLRVPQPRVSRHLAILREKGLVRVESRGRRRRYHLPESSSLLYRTLLAAIEPFVAATPMVRLDRQREPSLTQEGLNATKELHMDHAQARPIRESEADRQRQDLIFHALSMEPRRVLLDVVERNPGCPSSSVTQFVDMSRQAAERHLDVLEEAGLLYSEREGRQRLFYYNSMPLQLVYERWTDAPTAALSGHLSKIKRRVESEEESRG